MRGLTFLLSCSRLLLPPLLLAPAAASTQHPRREPVAALYESASRYKDHVAAGRAHLSAGRVAASFAAAADSISTRRRAASLHV